MRYFWALTLIVIGIAGLGSSLEWWDSNIIGNLLRFWPLIFVFWGLDVIFSKNRYYNLIMLGAILVSALFIWDVAFSDNPVLISKSNPKTSCCESKTENFSVDLSENTNSAKYSINTGAVDFKIKSGTDKLVEGKLESNITSPKLSVDQSKIEANVTLDTVTEEARKFYSWSGRVKNVLELKLNENIPIDLNVNSGASSMDFDLSDYTLSKALIKSGASSMKIKLGEKIVNGAIVQLETGVSSAKIEIPKNIGVKVTTETGLTSNDFRGFEKTAKNTYESQGYSNSLIKIEVILKAGASSIEINRF